jgi:hypothetical protein
MNTAFIVAPAVYRWLPFFRTSKSGSSQYAGGSAMSPSATITKDFKVWKDGKPTLCTATRSGDVYCY